MKKVFYFLSHPIQYQSPLLAQLSDEKAIDLTVYYFTRHTLKGVDRQFGKRIEWDIPLLEGYNYHFIKNWSWKPAVSGAFWGLINPGVIWILIKGRPDYIVVHGWAYWSNLFLLLAAKMLRIKVIMRAESPWKQEFSATWKKVLLKSFVSKALYLGVQNKKFYQEYGLQNDQLFFAPYCVDNERFLKDYHRLMNSRGKIRQQMGFEIKDVIVLFSGKYIPKKRPLDVIRAIAQLRNSNVKLVMVGEGILRQKMEQFVADHKIEASVFLTGFVNQSEISKYYSMADIFVLPSGRGETWGLVINEAMNFHLPIIASDMVGCTDDLVVDGENGFTYPCGDVDELKDKLQRLIDDVQKRNDFGAKSSAIINRYSFAEVIEGIKQAIA